jgi:hypothetical protein
MFVFLPCTKYDTFKNFVYKTGKSGQSDRLHDDGGSHRPIHGKERFVYPEDVGGPALLQADGAAGDQAQRRQLQ